MKKLAMMLVLCWSAAAGAVPGTINFSGRLTTSAGPVTGAVDLTLKLYDVASGGTPLWTETHNSVGADNGLVFVDVGAQTTLDDSVFDGRRLYLEVTVGSETLAPRLAINSVPYAMRATAASHADLLGTSIGPGDVVTSISGGNGVAASKVGNAVTVGLSTAGCNPGQVYKFNGTTFACAADADTTYSGGTGISVNGTTIGMSTTGCQAGFVWKYNGTTFACAADADTTYSAGTGIGISGTSISIDANVIPRLGAGNSFSGTNSFSNSNNSFAGNGASLSNLNASNLSAGTMPSGRLSGAYTGVTSVGTLDSLGVSGPISRNPTGTANMVPIAYGSVNGNGAINSSGSTSNFSVIKTGNTFTINIQNENYVFTNYVTIVTLNLSALCAVPIVSNDNAGRLVINMFTCADIPTPFATSFSFVTYKP